jgi:Domain of unknown function (DUF4270)
MNNFSLIKKLLFAVAAILLIASCDDEFDTLNSDIIDGDIHTDMERQFFDVTAYDRPTGAVQTSSLTTNFLGSYDNPVFGKTTASYVTQLEVATNNLNTEFTDHMVVDSVWAYIPYYSTVVSAETVDDTTRTTYTLNQVYGDSTAAFDLKIRRNNYYLRATDPSGAGNTAQNYYSDQWDELFESQQVTSLLNGGVPSVSIPGFSNTEHRRDATFVNDAGETKEVTAEVLAPGLFVYLDKQFFLDNFINHNAEANLINNTVFKNYFRGISFTTEQAKAMAALNFTAGYIKIKYTQDDFDSNDEPILDDNNNPTRESLTMTLNMTGVHVNLIKSEPKPDYTSAITNSDAVNGDDRLYIKGSEGSIALLDILKGNDLTALKAMVASDSIMINEANLIFYLDEDKMQDINVIPGVVGKPNIDDNPAPLRIYLYDINNKRPVYDYYTDGTTFNDTRFNRYTYGGIPLKDSRQRPYYKIRLTNHINNLVTLDSTNVKLGLAVTNLIDLTSNAQLRTPFSASWPGGNSDVTVSAVPLANAMNPFGVVLYGPNIPVGDNNYDKRLRLEIYYTKIRD